MNWITYTLISTFFFGLWGVFSKLASNYISYTSIFVYECLVFFIGGITVFALSGWRTEVHLLGITYSFLYGLTGLIAALFFIIAISKGPVSIITAITATYPCVTIILAFYFLHEKIAFKQMLGVILVIAGIFLLIGDENKMSIT